MHNTIAAAHPERARQRAEGAGHVPRQGRPPRRHCAPVLRPAHRELQLRALHLHRRGGHRGEQVGCLFITHYGLFIYWVIYLFWLFIYWVIY